MNWKYGIRWLLAVTLHRNCPNCGSSLRTRAWTENEWSVCEDCDWSELDGRLKMPGTPEGCLFVYREKAA